MNLEQYRAGFSQLHLSRHGRIFFAILTSGGLIALVANFPHTVPWIFGIGGIGALLFAFRRHGYSGAAREQSGRGQSIDVTVERGGSISRGNGGALIYNIPAVTVNGRHYRLRFRVPPQTRTEDLPRFPVGARLICHVVSLGSRDTGWKEPIWEIQSFKRK